MILPPFAAPEDFKSGVCFPNAGEVDWFIFSKGQLLVEDDKKTLPTQHDFVLQRTLYVRALKGRQLFAAVGKVFTQAKAKTLELLIDYQSEIYPTQGRLLLFRKDRDKLFADPIDNL